MATPESINNIVDEIFALKAPAFETGRRDIIRGFVETTINGDTVKAQLAINAQLTKEVRGALVYVLTDRRLVKFDILPNDFKSVTHPIDTITGVSRSLEGDIAGVNVTFQTGSFGLKYPSIDKKITDFFQNVDQVRVKDIK